MVPFAAQRQRGAPGAVPLIHREQFLGYIMAVNFDTENTQHIKDTLELTTFFIASEIANNRYIDQLRQFARIVRGEEKEPDDLCEHDLAVQRAILRMSGIALDDKL